MFIYTYTCISMYMYLPNVRVYVYCMYIYIYICMYSYVNIYNLIILTTMITHFLYNEVTTERYRTLNFPTVCWTKFVLPSSIVKWWIACQWTLHFLPSFYFPLRVLLKINDPFHSYFIVKLYTLFVVSVEGVGLVITPSDKSV